MHSQQYHDCSNTGLQQNPAFPQISKDYSKQEKNHLLYCISAYNAHCQVLVDVYFSLLSVKDT